MIETALLTTSFAENAGMTVSAPLEIVKASEIETAAELGISTRQVSRDKNSALAKMLKRMKAAGYESYTEAAGAFLQESDYIPTQMETQNSIMKKRTGEVRLPSDHKMKK